MVLGDLPVTETGIATRACVTMMAIARPIAAARAIVPPVMFVQEANASPVPQALPTAMSVAGCRVAVMRSASGALELSASARTTAVGQLIVPWAFPVRRFKMVVVYAGL
jgi:hypothetical protein